MSKQMKIEWNVLEQSLHAALYREGELKRERDEAREQLRLANIDCFAALTELDAAREKIAELLGKEGAK